MSIPTNGRAMVPPLNVAWAALDENVQGIIDFWAKTPTPSCTAFRAALDFYPTTDDVDHVLITGKSVRLPKHLTLKGDLECACCSHPVTAPRTVSAAVPVWRIYFKNDDDDDDEDVCIEHHWDVGRCHNCADSDTDMEESEEEGMETEESESMEED